MIDHFHSEMKVIYFLAVITACNLLVVIFNGCNHSPTSLIEIPVAMHSCKSHECDRSKQLNISWRLLSNFFHIAFRLVATVECHGMTVSVSEIRLHAAIPTSVH